LWRWSAVAVLTATATLFGTILFLNSDDSAVSGPVTPPLPSAGSPPESTAISPARSEEKRAVSARVSEIFALQDRAMSTRDEKLLRAVFATDCPCLRAGRERIRQLRADGLRWVGYRSRVSVARVERASDGTWSVTAVVSGARTRVETDERELLRIIPAATSKWTFVLTEPRGGGPLLLRTAAAWP
jgi:hypothetical protein